MSEATVLSIVPIGARVLIKQESSETVTKSGIILTKEKKLDKGTVVAVGNGDKDHPVTVEIGDVIYFEAYAGQDIEKDGVKYLLLKMEEVIAKDFIQED